ncbi:MAG: hypothetical protein BWY31_02805 [Lentisphaerae bacterium ADurb.Bin242]|nr:MAG: hypothetical protein BWY31_02805 [Lentisphaerae bacterium ADurb.Bin242]
MAQGNHRKLLFTVFLATSTFSFTMFPFPMNGGQLFGKDREGPPVSILLRGKAAAGKETSTGTSAATADNGGLAMRPAPFELLALYKERAELYQKTADFILRQVEAAAENPAEAIKAVVARDEAKLAYWRREKNMRPTKGAAETFLQVKEAKKLLQFTEGLYQDGTIPLNHLNRAKAKLLDAEIQLGEALLFVQDRATWDKAAKALDKYPDNVTDELLRALLDAELPGNPR